MRKRDKLRKKQAKIEIRYLLIEYKKAMQRAWLTRSDQDLGRVAIMEIVLPFKLRLAEMGGADAIVFTAGVGENSVPVRKMITDKLDYFGIKIDQEKNDCHGVERDLSADDAKIKTLLIPTNEELMIVRDIERLKKNN